MAGLGVRQLKSESNMKTQIKNAPLLLGLVVAMAAAGCSHLSLPPASRYNVLVGQVAYSATSVRMHGRWIELQTDKGPVWFNERSIVSISPVP